MAIKPAAPGLCRASESKQKTSQTSHHETALLTALMVLTFSTGLIDAVSYIGLGRVFVANMTGNVVLLGFAAAGVSGLSLTRALLSLAGFLIGAATGGKLGTSLASGSRRRLIIIAGSLEALLIFVAGVASIGFDIHSAVPVYQLYAMIGLTALSMGLRNATVRQLRVADITTTVLTLTLTGLAADSPVAGGTNPRPVRRIFSIVALLVGALCGAYLLRYGVALPLFVTAACVLATTATYAVIAAAMPTE
jgi:uncharacterized membrane protein YoaK (UPF0700 family)